METTRAKHKHVEQLNGRCNHGRDLLAANRVVQERVIRLGRSILAFHTTTDKEEQKCIERLAKERP
jgi:ATP-dependent helicase STH1/SNF2